MAGSNSEWGQLAASDPSAAEVWDGYALLPDPGDNEALDSLCERRRITINDLVRLGARLAEPTTLAYAYSGGIRYRSLMTDRIWTLPGSKFDELKILPGTNSNGTVIIAEGETDGARLSGHYDCDVAVMPGGAGYFPPSFVDQLRHYETIYVGLDTDNGSKKGIKQILEALPQSQRFSPEPFNDWCSVEDDLPPLPKPKHEGLLNVGGLIFEDLSRVLVDGAVPEPEVLVDDLLYTEGVHWISGHPGSGKTTLTMHTAIQVMSEGRHVVWFDYEGGARPTLRRLLACDCPVELLLGFFHYAGWVKDSPQYFQALAERWPGVLVVIDSASKSLQTGGFDENSPSEVTTWVGPIVKAVKSYSLPMVIIDHVPKSASAGYAYSRGAGSKMADTDVAWYVEKVHDFNRTTAGGICVHQQKDREGCLPFKVWFKVGDGAGKLELTPTDGWDEADDDGSDQPAI